jgi:hypothetical protein
LAKADGGALFVTAAGHSRQCATDDGLPPLSFRQTASEVYFTKLALQIVFTCFGQQAKS